MKKTPMQELIDIIQNKFEDDFGKNDYTTGLNTAYKSVLAEIEINNLLEKEKNIIISSNIDGVEAGVDLALIALKTSKNKTRQLYPDKAEQYYKDKFKC